MDDFLIRRAGILQIAAEKAFRTPLKSSGFWAHNDLPYKASILIVRPTAIFHLDWPIFLRIQLRIHYLLS